MFLEAVIVCVDFGDFLSTTLPINRREFSRTIVVTSPEDELTEKVSVENGATLLLTTRYRENGTFNKGKAINDGLALCKKRGWVVLLDADISFPRHFHRRLSINLKREPMQGQTLYGLHRLMCPSYQEWLHYLRHRTHVWRLDKRRGPRKKPAGYFQLWNAREMPNVRYPENYPDKPDAFGGYHGDLAFARSFPRCRHLEAPYLIHLDAKGNGGASDYAGRTSPRWGDTG